MSVDSERNNVLRKKNELNKLKIDLSKEQSKIAPLQKKIIDANTTIKRTKIQSTIKSKINEIERANKGINDATKKVGDIQKKIGQKEKELSELEKKLQKAELAEKKKFEKESKMRFSEIDVALDEHSSRQEVMEHELAELKKLPQSITILFLASNPKGTGQLRLDEESRNIYERIRMSEYRDTIKFETRWAVRASDIFQAINETNPTIIHFSGHGCDNGDIVLENPDGSPKRITSDAISQVIATVSDNVRLVFFNACYSESQANKIVEYIDASIGMETSIGDEAACVFASQFYSSIGFGLSLETSFKQAVAALLLEGIPEDQTPKLYCKSDIDANNIYFVAK